MSTHLERVSNQASGKAGISASRRSHQSLYDSKASYVLVGIDAHSMKCFGVSKRHRSGGIVIEVLAKVVRYDRTLESNVSY